MGYTESRPGFADTDVLKQQAEPVPGRRTGFKDIFRRFLPYLLLLALSALFLLIFSLWTSPFYRHWYGCDCSFFTMVGRGITEGMVPYRDFFDLKGPYFFFIEALGQLIAADQAAKLSKLSEMEG